MSVLKPSCLSLLFQADATRVDSTPVIKKVEVGRVSKWAKANSNRGTPHLLTTALERPYTLRSSWASDDVSRAPLWHATNWPKLI